MGEADLTPTQENNLISGEAVDKLALKEKKYMQAVEQARSLMLPTETMTMENRFSSIDRVVEIFMKSVEDDRDSFKEAVEIMTRLVRSSHLSEQQIGIIVRAQRKLGEIYPKEKEVDLSSEELKIIQAGDFEAVKGVFQKYPKRKDSWNRAEALLNNSSKKKTVYRGMMSIDESDVELVVRHGFVPQGLRVFGTLEELITRKSQSLWDTRDIFEDDREKFKIWLMRELPFSKVNLLHEVYKGGEFGSSSPYKLGISTTTPENLQEKTGSFFGNYVFRIEIPENRLITTINKGDAEDERTVLCYIPPEAITGHTFVAESASKALDTLPPHTWWNRLFK